MLRSIEANEEGFAERDGVRVHYQVFGEGEQAVLFDEKLEEHDGWLKWNRHYWRADWPGFLEFFFSKCFTEPDSRSEIEHFFEMGMETDPDTIIATIQAPGLDESTAERLAASIRIPTLVIHGDHDAITPLHRGKTLARLGGAEMVVLSGSGHEPQCRVPERVNGMLDEFLSRHFRAI